MRARHFSAGEVIFEIGGPADAVYQLRSGTVMLSQRDPAGALLAVAELGPGSIFGEAGIMAGGARTLRAEALTPAVVDEVGRQELLAAADRDPRHSHGLVHAMLGDSPAAGHVMGGPLAPGPSLHSAPGPSIDPLATIVEGTIVEGATVVGATTLSSAIMGASAAGGEFGIDPSLPLLLLPAGPTVAEQIGSDGVGIYQLPFHVGRVEEAGQRRTQREDRLLLEDRRPFQLSRRHFGLERSGREIVVRDQGSHHGTIVNGKRIGAEQPARTMSLVAGRNEIIGGRASSPFRFLVIIGADHPVIAAR